LQDGLKARTGTDDTHPSLSDRLEALAERPHVDWALTTTAAEALFGEMLPSYIARLDSEWKENIAASWRERHQNVREIRSKLAEMESAAAVQPLTLEQAWQRATWTEEVDKSENALPLYQEVLRLNPNHASAQFAVGRLQLAQGRLEGIHWIEQAMKQDSEFRYPGCGLIAGFLQQQGKEEEAKQYRRKAAQQAEVLEAAYQERSGLSLKDSFTSHGLMEEQLELLSEQLMHFPDVAEAYLVRRIVEHLPEKPLYVLGVVPNVSWYQFRWESADTKLVQSLTEKIVLPGEGFIVAFNSGTKKIAKKAKRIAGSRFYRRLDR
jgi:tetratricopeptide (TPR) repeat protein